VQRESHMRAAVVDRMNIVAVSDQAERVAVEADDQPLRFAELGKTRGADERGDLGECHRNLLSITAPYDLK
jgi:hypothetical protein